MVHAGMTMTTEGETAGIPLARSVSHRKLAATIFPQSGSEEIGDFPADVVDQEEMIHCAASQGMLSSVLALLKDWRYFCDVPDRFGRTPLHWAAEQGHCNVVIALLKAGACVDPSSKREATPIMLAASCGHEKVVEVLLRHRAGESDYCVINRYLDGIGHWKSTTLHRAAAGGHARTVQKLLDAGFDRRQKNEEGETPAEISARQSHSTSVATTRILLPTSDRGGKLLYDCVNRPLEDVAVVSGLVTGGAFLSWQGETGETPLHRAAFFQHATILRVLLHAGADPNARGRGGACPLHIAAFFGRSDIVADLVGAGADTELLALCGQSALHIAVVKNRFSVTGLLLNGGASTEHRDTTHGRNPLSWACRGCLSPIVRILVEAGADVESRCSARLTPLHWACRFNDAESVETLLNAGADPGAVDQAAAAGVVATSSLRSGMIASLPVTIDVIGLGYPLGSTDDSTRTFRGFSVGFASRRWDLASVRRIELALRSAKKERSWRRRGWLVIVGNRRAAVEKLRARGEQRGVRRKMYCCHAPPVLTPSRCVNTLIEHPQCDSRKAAVTDAVSASTNSYDSDSSGSRHPHEIFSKIYNVVGKRPRSVDTEVMIARATPCQQGQACGGTGAQQNVEALRPDLINALLELVAIEVGLFRRAVLFV